MSNSALVKGITFEKNFLPSYGMGRKVIHFCSKLRHDSLKRNEKTESNYSFFLREKFRFASVKIFKFVVCLQKF